MVDIHDAIRKKFQLFHRADNLPYGCGRRHSRITLAQLLGELQFNVGAEIGVRRGSFSKILFGCNPALKLYCVDPWEPYNNRYTQERQDRIYAQCLENLQGLDVVIIRKRSMDALADVQDGSLDFVFIDGNHSFDYVAPDIIYWSMKVRAGGIVACHDYYAFGWSGVVQAVDGYTFCHDIRPWYVTKELEPTAFWVKP